MPVTTKAQQKAENAKGAKNAKGKVQFYSGFCESSEKLSATKGCSNHLFGTIPHSFTFLLSSSASRRYDRGDYANQNDDCQRIRTDNTKLNRMVSSGIGVCSADVKNRDCSSSNREEDAITSDDQMPHGNTQFFALRRDGTSQGQ